MIRLRKGSVYLSAAIVIAMQCSAGFGKDDNKKDEPKWLIDRKLTIAAQAAPTPALKYRLFPLHLDRKDGNAVPIYLRLVHEQKDETRRAWMETPQKWNELPLDKVPLKEARQFLDSHGRMLQQIELGARRKTAEWNYTMDQGSVIEILLPDMHSMRSYVPLLMLKARVAMIDGNYKSAAHTIETGLAFSQHIAEGQFVINGLVSLACATRMLECLHDWVERPDSPNLYWALTAVPRPLIDIRVGMDFEQRVFEYEFPELAKFDTARTTEQWEEILQNMRRKIEKLVHMSKIEEAMKPRPGTKAGEPAATSPELPQARAYLKDRLGIGSQQLDAMPPAQMLLMYFVNHFKDVRDDQFKISYLPYPEAITMAATVSSLEKGVANEAERLPAVFLPAWKKILLAYTRVERRMAALRVIESLRMHAAANKGQLPEKLSDITIVPVPNDPGTNRPFDYVREGKVVTLIGRIPGEPDATSGIRYQITMRD